MNGTTDRSNDYRPEFLAFADRASGRLSGVRNGLLIFDQDPGSDGDIDLAIRNLQLIRKDAVENGAKEIEAIADECENELRILLENGHGTASVGHALDLVAKIEESLLKIPLKADDFLPDVGEFVDRSFDILETRSAPRTPATVRKDDFEPDEETMDIFRSEASDLINNIKQGVYSLGTVADDREALWDVRRNAHTFKGAAGIVGFRKASELAHRVEDVLDRLVESNTKISAETLDLISRSSWILESWVTGSELPDEAEQLGRLNADLERLVDPSSSHGTGVADLRPNAALGSSSTAGRDETAKAFPSPIVRVSLDRLDELIKLTRDLSVNHSALVQRFSEFEDPQFSEPSEEWLAKLSQLLNSQHSLTYEVQEKLFGIRLVRFGTLETRISRVVNVTCQETGKSCTVTIENGDCEIDTQVIDALIEPLLHLLKNAVVHGIEPPERRRLIGKPVKGQIRISVDKDEFGVTLEVTDDGQGISTQKLKQNALRNELLSPETVASLGEQDALELVFHRGLSTSEKIDLNAGRGIGMSIVKESIESKGGSITIFSLPQTGTTFTIRMPLILKEPVNIDRTPIPPDSVAGPTPTASKLILIVDDSAVIRRKAAQMVVDAKHRAITATDGTDAMELLLSDVWKPDLIFSDIEMPNMDGWEFLECVKNTESLAEIPVVVVTSLDTDEHRHRAMLLGATDYLVKPLNTELILRTLSSLDAASTAKAAGLA